MQTKDQVKRLKDWKVVAAVTTASALGFSGLALAGGDDVDDTPDPIQLTDVTPITEVTVAKSTSTTLAELGIDVETLDSAASPFDDQLTVDQTASPVSVASPVSAASPVSPASPASADTESPASPVSADSVESADSVDNSADS